MVSFYLALAVAGLAVVGGIAAVLRKRRTLASMSFCAGMIILAGEIVLGEMVGRALGDEEQARWQSLRLIVGSFLPGCWLTFSLTYSRGDVREVLVRNRWVLLSVLLIPVAVAVGFRDDLIRPVRLGETGDWMLEAQPAARALAIFVLLVSIGVLINLERTFRAAVGTTRWRIKYVILGVGLIFGAKIYVLSQKILFSGVDPDLVTVETAALLLGCGLFGIAHGRKGFSDLDIYPSRAVLQNSLTVLLVGAYLLVVGVLAQVVALLGGIEGFQAKAFIVLLGILGLAILLLSDRRRSGLRQFVTRHFKRPEHDYRSVWTQTSEELSSHLDRAGLCGAAVAQVSRTFEALSVAIFLVDEHTQSLKPEFTTSRTCDEQDDGGTQGPWIDDPRVLEGIRAAGKPTDLMTLDSDWATSLRNSIRTQFASGEGRVVVPLLARHQLVGMISLADRVNGVAYTANEMELLTCIGNQIAAALLNLRLNEDLRRGKELEAFQTVSTFFVHDLKNAANSLSLMLQNLPVHFDDPEFREDALRAIGKTVDRINSLTERLGALRSRLVLQLREGDLNSLIQEALEEAAGSGDLEVVQNLQPLPAFKFDPQQIKTVLSNLIFNARDAVGEKGRLMIETARRDDSIFVTVKDNGCGMSADFLRNDLFRPFRSTKSKGLGIGMFQSRMIVEEHGGSLRVESTPGEGTSVCVCLPVHQPPSAENED